MLEIRVMTGAVAGFRVTGQLTADDYDRLIGEIESKLAQYERIAIYADATELGGISIPALAKDLRYGLSKLKDLHRFRKLAVVTDSTPLRIWIGVLASIFPQTELRSFGAAERAGADAWVSAEDRGERRALRWLKTTRPDTYAFECDGVITGADMDEVLAKLNVEFEQRIAVRVLARVVYFGGIVPQAFLRGALLRLKALGVRKIERYAVVGGPHWLGRYAQLVRQLTGIDMRHYALDAEADAWAWLEAQPVGANARPLEGAPKGA